MLFVSLLLIFLIIILCLIYLIFLIRRCHLHFKKQSITSPPLTSYIYGHFHLLWNSKNFSEQLYQWTKMYGSIYGLVAGTRPVYIVSDTDFLQEVFINQFSKFHGRHIPLLTHILEKNRLHIFASNGEQWRCHRQIIVSAFSSIKLQNMSLKMNQCIQTFINLTNDNDMNILIRLKQFTLDVICKFITRKTFCLFKF